MKRNRDISPSYPGLHFEFKGQTFTFKNLADLLRSTVTRSFFAPQFICSNCKPKLKIKSGRAAQTGSTVAQHRTVV